MGALAQNQTQHVHFEFSKRGEGRDISVPVAQTKYQQRSGIPITQSKNQQKSIHSETEFPECKMM